MMIEGWLIWLGLPAETVAAMRLDLLWRLLLAALLGGVIGLEREISGKAAGLRTNLLICVGSALLMEVSIQTALVANVANEEAGYFFRADPARIAAQIVSGIGFLGAGTILQARGNVVGLTTAATIWVVAGIGMAVGAHAYVEAVGATALVFFALVILSRVEAAVVQRKRMRRYVVVVNDAELVDDIVAAVEAEGLIIDVLSIEKREGLFEVSFSVVGAAKLHDRAIRSLISHSGVERLTHGI
jgi:putative Mg2+ transporter-C (MgtC) family protein